MKCSKVAWRGVAAAAVFVAFATPVVCRAASSGHEPPYQKLATALGTPVLARSFGTKSKSELLLDFVPSGESYGRWNKMTSVSIAKVQPGETDLAMDSIVAKFKAALATKHAHVLTFDRRTTKPASTYFSFTAGGQSDEGIAYSPASGYVSVIQIARKPGVARDANDGALLQRVAGR